MISVEGLKVKFNATPLFEDVYKRQGKDRSSLMNSYEVGLSTSLMFPRVVFPRFGDKEYDFPATTTFKLYIDQLNRAKSVSYTHLDGNRNFFRSFREHARFFTTFAPCAAD